MRNIERLQLILLCALAYFLLDVPVQMIGILPSFIGIKNFLPPTLGLFFGFYGVTGCVIGCAAGALLVNSSLNAAMYECFCIIVTGLVMFYGMHMSRRGRYSRPDFKSWPDYVRYTVMLTVGACLCMRLTVILSYIITGLFIGLPVNILFSSLLYIEPVMPAGKTAAYDAQFCLMPDTDSLESANEILESAGEKRGASMKQVISLQSLIEELSIRIMKANPDATISVSVIFGEAMSARLEYGGKKYNPFHIKKDEDEIDIIGLTIIKHRAIRASYSYSRGINYVHAVV